MDAKKLDIDLPWMQEVMLDLLRIPSPAGRTDEIMQYVGELLQGLGLEFSLSRRGAMVARLGGRRDVPERALVVHTDTIGVMVHTIKPNGRLRVAPIGTHSARFSEGARVTVFTDGPERYTGTILPLLASGHAYDVEVDTQGVGWDHVELRIDEPVPTADDVRALGISPGDFVALQALPEITPSGFVKARHLDDKAGVAAALAAVKAILEHDVELDVPARLLITITEEVGHGASHGLQTGVSEMVSIDSAVVAPVQHSTETGVTIAMQDLHGPFDYHLTRKLLRLAAEHGIEANRDVFTHYRSDVASAIEAGAEMRAALIGFGTDATHGHERTHLDSIRQVAELTAVYLQTDLTHGDWDVHERGPLAEFPSTSVQPAPREPGIQPAPEDDDQEH
jgi:peptidase M42 family hydrolase